MLRRLLQEARSQPIPKVHPQQEAVTARLEALRRQHEATAAAHNAALTAAAAQQSGVAAPAPAGLGVPASPACEAIANSQPASAATPAATPKRSLQPLWQQQLAGGGGDARQAQAAPAPPLSPA